MAVQNSVSKRGPEICTKFHSGTSLHRAALSGTFQIGNQVTGLTFIAAIFTRIEGFMDDRRERASNERVTEGGCESFIWTDRKAMRKP